MRKFDTVIFDLDGTLLNTLDDLADSVCFTMALFGYPSRTVAEVRDFVGNGVGRLIGLSIPGGTGNPDYKACLEEFRRHYDRNMLNKTKPYDGIMALLRDLDAHGFKMAVVSNKFDTAVKELCRVCFGELIPVAIGESVCVPKKPAPDIVTEALKALGAPPGRAVYVGDSEVDAETAKNAGIPFIGVTWGFRDRCVLEKEGADFIIDKPGELPGFLGIDL
jgi:phosphoglycolate phosphatase